MAIPLIPLRKPTNVPPLPVMMSGVRMGERVLQIGIDDPAIAAGIAAKVGLSGHAVIVVTNDHLAVRARTAAAAAAVAVDVRVAPLDRLPYEDDTFDAVVIHSRSEPASTLPPPARDALLHAVHRRLRPGGRL